MALDGPHPIIGIVQYDGAQRAAVLGLVDLFETASRLAQDRSAQSPQIAARLLTPPFAEAEAGPEPLDALILPPSLEGGSASPAVPDALISFLRAQHETGTLLCSICAGAFILAGTGLLAGRPATTHWALAERFAETYPDVALDTDELIVDQGDIITAGGLMAWIDLGLRLVERFLGPSVMLATARFFLVDPAGRQQRFYSSFAPRLSHGDAAVLKVQRWLAQASGEKLSIPRMAAEAGLGERTFLRRFQAATGLKPTAYLQMLRVAKARDLIELTRQSIDQIAWQVGYDDAGAFRRVFQRITGLTPGEYRKRFSVAEG